MALSRKEREALLEETRLACENDLYTFACTVEPHRCYGEVHKELFRWWQYEAGDNSLCLLPRDHQKSHCMAVLTAWQITRDPAVTILYISATSLLAEQQLNDIKQILTCKQYRMLWPDMIHPEEGKREKWTTSQISVDHPKRKAEGVRDSTILAAGLTTNTTGLHCKLIMKDDVVVPDNAYTEEGRRKVAAAASQLASILTTGGQEFCVGTRYHPADHYADLKTMHEEVFDADGEVTGKRPVYKIFEKVVEEHGEFLWPKQWRPEDNKCFGFDHSELARKKAKYLDTTQFFAQYYNNPNDIENRRLDRTKFQYYDKSKLECRHGVWFYGNRRLNVYAGVDFAFSMSANADYTCVMVVGVDSSGNIYVLDIDRFKTNKMDTYFEKVLTMHSKWGFHRLKAEVTAAQKTIVEYIKDRAKDLGMSLRVEEHRPNKYQGSKEERIAAALEPRYDNLEIWHFKGGHTDNLEEELIQANPRHDDLKDTLALIVSTGIKRPSRVGGEDSNNGVVHLRAHPRFGGVAF